MASFKFEEGYIPLLHQDLCVSSLGVCRSLQMAVHCCQPAEDPLLWTSLQQGPKAADTQGWKLLEWPGFACRHA